LPKPMAPVAGRPFLEYVLDKFVVGGITEITLSVGYQADVIINHFGHQFKGIPIRYSKETEPLGTGGGIVHALKKGSNKPVLIVNGDTLLDIDYKVLIDWYEKSQSEISMVLRKMSDVSRYGAVNISENKVIGFTEKGKAAEGYINAGVYFLKPEVFREYDLSKQFSFESDFLQKYCSVLMPMAFLTEEYFIDIGIPEDYQRAQVEFPSLI